jgi:NAD(P)-dependent dehydrogenase (short-subunit alcohol dehydrogenase family)
MDGLAGELAGKVAVVTGAGSGIGRAIALGLAREGVTVAVCDIDAARAETVAAEVRAAGPIAIAVRVDVASLEEISAMVARVIEELGRIDILCNCAGIFPRTPFFEISEAEWQHVLDVNLTGTFRCCRAVAEHMSRNGGGKIVNIASGRGVTGSPRGAAYSASKGGVLALTVSLGIELGPLGINVNAVAPGPIDTPLYRGDREEGWQPPQNLPVNQRVEPPEEVVGPVLFLVSEASRSMFGQTVFLKQP